MFMFLLLFLLFPQHFYQQFLLVPLLFAFPPLELAASQLDPRIMANEYSQQTPDVGETAPTIDDTLVFTAGSSLIGDTPHAVDSNVSVTPLHARQIDFDGMTHGSEGSQSLPTMRNLLVDTQAADETMEPEGANSSSSAGVQGSRVINFLKSHVQSQEPEGSFGAVGAAKHESED